MFEIPGGREGAPAATAWLLALLDVMGGLTTTVTKKGQNTRLITRALVMQKPKRRSRETTQ
jgi:hypothetical protein